MRCVENVAHGLLLLIAEPERTEIHRNSIALQQAHDDTLAVNCRDGRDTQIVFHSAHTLPEAAVLGQAALGDIQVRHDLDARDNRRRGLQRW